MIRTAQDFAAAGHEQPLAWLDALIEREDAELGQLMIIADALPETSVVLAPLALRLQTIITDKLAALAEERPHEVRPYHAGSLLRLALRLSQVGRRQEALGPAQEAVDLYRALAEEAPDDYRPDLAMSLSVLADRLEELDRLEEAVASDDEAVNAIAEPLLAQPNAWAPQALPILRDYVRRCEKLGREPDAELLGPIVEVLQRLQEDRGDEADNDEEGGS